MLAQAAGDLRVATFDDYEGPAAGALRALHTLQRLQTSDSTEKILKKVKACVRDVAVLRLKYSCEDPRSKFEFDSAIAHSYSSEMDEKARQEWRSCLINSYHKVTNGGFLNTKRRPRKGRRHEVQV